MKVLLGIDIGTSGAKAVAITRDGARIGDAAERYPTLVDGGGAEQDAEGWWDAAVRAVERAVGSHIVEAVAVTSQAPTVVPVDSDGRPTSPALTWLDRRADSEAARISDLVPQSRNGADPFFGTAKLPWLATHRPAALELASHVLSPNGFIERRLTGISVLDDTTASLMQGFDEEADGFADALLVAEPSLRYLPTVVPAAAVIGTVTAQAATQIRIPEGTPVVAGGIDSIGSALEASVLAVGAPLVDMTGFSSVTILAVERGTTVPGFIHARHAVPGVDLLITAQVTAGATVDWVNGLDAAVDHRDDAAILDRARPGHVTMVSALAGERTPTWNRSARGIIDGISLDTDATDLMLAAMEGNAYALAHDIDVMRAYGYSVDRLVSTGGGATSDAWLQIKSDVLGVPVERPAAGHGAAQGAAMLAGVATGRIASFDELATFGHGTEASFAPDANRAPDYASARDRWSEMSALNTTRTRAT